MHRLVHCARHRMKADSSLKLYEFSQTSALGGLQLQLHEIGMHLDIVSLHSSNFLSFLSLKGRYSGTCHPKGPPTMHFYLKFSFTSIIVILFSLYYQTKKSLAARRGLFRGWQTLSANGAKKDGWKNGIGTVSSPVGKTVPVKVNMSTAAAKSR